MFGHRFLCGNGDGSSSNHESAFFRPTLNGTVGYSFIIRICEQKRPLLSSNTDSPLAQLLYVALLLLVLFVVVVVLVVVWVVDECSSVYLVGHSLYVWWGIGRPIRDVIVQRNSR